MVADKKNSFSFTERKRLRAYYGKYNTILNIPSLLKIQLNSYKKFLQYKLKSDERKNIGLVAAFNSIFPIESYTGISEIHFIDYNLGNTPFDVYECRVRGATYSIPLKIKISFLQFHKSSIEKHRYSKEKSKDISNKKSNTKQNNIKKKEKIIKQRKEQEIYIGDIPFMTSNGTFIINGTERVVVSQLHRSPGVFFEHDKGKTHASGKLLYSARIIPYRGSWLDFEFDSKECIYARIDRKKKLPVTILLKAMDFTTEKILATFFDVYEATIHDSYIITDFRPKHIIGETFYFDIKSNKNHILTRSGQKISEYHIKKIQQLKIKQIKMPISCVMKKTRKRYY